MKINLFVDDVRLPSDLGLVDEDYVIRTNFDDALAFITFNKPQHICFDHYLTKDERRMTYETGYNLARELIKLDKNQPTYITDEFTFSCHSSDSSMNQRTEKMLKEYINSKFSRKSNDQRDYRSAKAKRGYNPYRRNKC